MYPDYPDEKKFDPKVGDTVHFKSGSPNLLVVYVCPKKPGGENPTVICGWFDTIGKYREQEFREYEGLLSSSSLGVRLSFNSMTLPKAHKVLQALRASKVKL